MKSIKKILLIFLSLAAVILGLKIYYQNRNDSLPSKEITNFLNGIEESVKSKTALQGQTHDDRPKLLNPNISAPLDEEDKKLTNSALKSSVSKPSSYSTLPEKDEEQKEEVNDSRKLDEITATYKKAISLLEDLK